MYLRAYLFTCSTPGVRDKLHKMVWPREHFYEHVHLYSVSDLVVVCRGGLVSNIQEAVAFGRTHVRDCFKCQARGFHCEICKSDEILFPFDLEVTQTCPECSAVYHRSCTKRITECPRCVRRDIRKLKLQENQEQGER